MITTKYYCTFCSFQIVDGMSEGPFIHPECLVKEQAFLAEVSRTKRRAKMRWILALVLIALAVIFGAISLSVLLPTH